MKVIYSLLIIIKLFIIMLARMKSKLLLHSSVMQYFDVCILAILYLSIEKLIHISNGSGFEIKFLINSQSDLEYEIPDKLE